MVNAFKAVQQAQLPIAAVKLPPIGAGSDAVLDASGSAALVRTHDRRVFLDGERRSEPSSRRSSSDKATILPGAGTVTLTVTDNMGGTGHRDHHGHLEQRIEHRAGERRQHRVPDGAAGDPVPPTIAQAFSPASVGPTIPSTLTLHVAQRKCLCAHPKQLQRYAAHGVDDRQLCRSRPPPAREPTGR